MHKLVIIVYGPPGSGKGTQANLLADKLGLIHFDTGRFLESVVYDPARRKSKTIKRERRNFETGKLMTPSFVHGEVSKAVRKIHKAGWGAIFSGSPRTVFEAERLYPLLARLYGKESIHVFLLELPQSFSIKRNSKRLICSVCGYGLLTAYYPSSKPKYCPVCGGRFYRRAVDKPEVIKIRLKEYHNRTEPVLQVVKRLGYKVYKLDARPAPYKVLKKILHHLKP